MKSIDDLTINDYSLNTLIRTISELRSNFTEWSIDSVVSDLDLLSQNINENKVTIGFFGDFNCGKSTLINKLLYREVLPVTKRVNTCMNTYISHCYDKEHIMHVNPQGINEHYEVCDDSWNCLTYQKETHKQGKLYLNIHNNWLEENNVKLIDTFGFVSHVSGINELVKTIDECDYVVFCLSAMKLFSFEEKAFLEEVVIRKQASKIIFAVNFFDLISDEHRFEILDYIKRTAKSFGLSNLLYIINGCDRGIDSEYYRFGLDNLKKQIQTWAISDSKIKYTINNVSSHLLCIVDRASSDLDNRRKLLDIAKGSLLNILEELK